MVAPRVLICERDRDALAAVAAGLEGAGFATVSCAEALAPDQPAPDIAVIDLTLPAVSPLPRLNHEGVALAERLAKAQVPFVFVTEHRNDELIRFAVQSGATGYFVKPIDPALLAPSIHAWLARAAEARRCREERDALRGAVSDSRTIGTAVGRVAERCRLTPQQAFDTLRRRARSERRSLADLATSVAAGREMPGDG